MKKVIFPLSSFLLLSILFAACSKPQPQPSADEQYQQVCTQIEALFQNDSISEAEGDSLMSLYVEQSVAIANEHPGHAVCYAIVGDLYYYMSTPQKKTLIDMLNSDSIEAHQLTKFTRAFAAEWATREGEAYTDLTAPGISGQPVFLSEYVGQTDYLLIDFWATWCGPCRASLPALKELYAEAPEGRFQIVGVSLDNDAQRWTNYIADNQLSWIHMSDLAGWQSAPASAYGVCSIPSTVLLNRDGIIIARNPSHDQLRLLILQ